MEVCSGCCAAIRDAECGDCVHYGAAQQHEATRSSRVMRRAALPEGDFIIELNPELEEAVNDALARGQQGQMKQAMATMAGLLREHPRSHHVCFGMGVLHGLRNDNEQAIEWLDKAIEIFPYMIEARFNKAVAYQNLGDLPNGIQAFQKVVELGADDDPEVAKAKAMLATIDAGLRRQEGIGVDEFVTSNVVFMRAFELLRQGAWQQAADGFREVIVVNDRNVASHGNLGLCYAQLGHKAKALAELDRALELDPTYQPAKQNRKAALAMVEGSSLGRAIMKTY